LNECLSLFDSGLSRAFPPDEFDDAYSSEDIAQAIPIKEFREFLIPLAVMNVHQPIRDQSWYGRLYSSTQTVPVQS
jgi:hypothetical protein